MTSRHYLLLTLLLSTLTFTSIFRRQFQAERIALLTTICAIQGEGSSSPYKGQEVVTQGIVFADFDEKSQQGFYIQHTGCDLNPATSDGIFVYLGERKAVVSPGDLVQVIGVVQEYYGMTEIVSGAPSVTLLSPGNPLPPPTNLEPPFANQAARVYFETLEGMFTGFTTAVTVGPTDSSGQSYLVNLNLGLNRVFQDDPRGTGEVVCVANEGNFKVDPQVKVGDRVSGLVGAFGFTYGEFCLQLTANPIVIPIITSSPRFSRDITQVSRGGLLNLRLATFNLHNLFDTIDDPLTEDDVLSTTEYQRRLQKRALALHSGLNEPELVAVQEVENGAVIADLINRSEIVAQYGVAWLPGPDKRGLDTALLYRIQVGSYQTYQSCTTLTDGLGLDGNGDVSNPQNTLTCDTNGDGTLDGNRLFSRPPLVARLWVCEASCTQPGRAGTELWVIVNHLKSKTEDSLTMTYTLSRRVAEAHFVAKLVTQIRDSAPGANIIMLGDLNDYPASEPVSILLQTGLLNAVASTPADSRYSNVYQGISQVFDYQMLDLNPPVYWTTALPVHINADFPEEYTRKTDSLHRSSDHDPVVVELFMVYHKLYIPLLIH